MTAQQTLERLLETAIRDITERSQAQATLRRLDEELEDRVRARTTELSAMLREKEVLLKEVHHRIKNDLQVISSLLGLQSLHLADPQARIMLLESQDRVQSIALVHEALCASSDMARVDFARYAHMLVDRMVYAHDATAAGVAVSVEVAAIQLSVELAIPCGLIVNELVTNALRHAFIGGGPGAIRVELRETAPRRVALSVADDGVGLPDDVDVGRTRSLGLDIVATLARQLDARITVARAPGTRVELGFAVMGEP